MSDAMDTMTDSVLPDSLSERIGGVLREIRVPDLPYPVGQPEQSHNWTALLREHWSRQTDQRVSAVLADLEGPWSVQQVNGAYLADRIMDVFLRSSGLHPVLVTRLARLRYPLAWRLVEEERPVFAGLLVSWLDSFADWRGWSDSGGRSSRALLDQLDRVVEVVDQCFLDNDLAPFANFCEKWHREADRRHQHSSRLHQRLLETEAGAARQRRADQLSRAIAGRAMEGRQLPAPMQDFLIQHWLPLLRQLAWREGDSGDNWRHATRLLEWMVWVGDPALSGQETDRLYQVGEQLSDRIAEVWQRIWEEAPPRGPLAAVETVLVDRLRGGDPVVESTRARVEQLDYDPAWLETSGAQPDSLEQYRKNWFVEGSGDQEQRRFFLAYLDETAEVLWSNGYGVRLGLTRWHEFRESLDAGRVRPLPPLTRFGDVLADTVAALDRVLASQRSQRQAAARKARERADHLRQQREAEARQRAEAEAARKAEAERQAKQAREQAEQAEADRLEAVREAARARAVAEVDRLNMGGWIALKKTPDNDEQRLKLAVRINASRKLVFVDRLGLNRTELTVDDLVERLLSGTARLLGASAEFDETLSRVVGRIRVGR
ncbi:DUF1631 family protein [Marinobacter zhanjiangensis]|uniref:DUF1631 domain-containing protein n=1 Tax=Marinobacter zhanjiangensis TaxID=578215 RepID=A0ABQ3B6K7_9GAMM|nr:DUF1631 family protein [Marinobacter zhanjiangensis]GGY82253.1 hypothetical protein GCM10007071_32060 [Marinobacter zhanjiangensis]